MIIQQSSNQYWEYPRPRGNVWMAEPWSPLSASFQMFWIKQCQNIFGYADSILDSFTFYKAKKDFENKASHKIMSPEKKSVYHFKVWRCTEYSHFLFSLFENNLCSSSLYLFILSTFSLLCMNPGRLAIFNNMENEAFVQTQQRVTWQIVCYTDDET